MKMELIKDGRVRFAELNPATALLLRALPFEAEPGDDKKARERLYPAPSRDTDDPEFLDDWKEWVTPELERLFQSAVETVANDLREGLKENESDGMEVTFPATHVDAWLSCLNQARLSVSAQAGFTEQEMEDPSLLEEDPTRTARWFQVHFYGVIQSLLLSGFYGEPLDDDDPAEDEQ